MLAGLAARQLDTSFNLGKALGAFSTSNLVSIAGYVILLAVPLYLVARRVQQKTE